jgi:hypothetical protein
MALSSAYELETQLLLLTDLFAIEIDEVFPKLQSIQRKIGGLKRKLNN